MGQTPSRGDAVSGYLPPFGANVSGAKIYGNNMKMSIVSGSIANSGVVYAVAHGLGKAPSFCFLTPFGTVGGLKAAATSANSVGLASVSAATATNIYVAGAKNTKFYAICILA